LIWFLKEKEKKKKKKSFKAFYLLERVSGVPKNRQKRRMSFVLPVHPSILSATAGGLRHRSTAGESQHAII
jgi:hypothetical protein